MPQAVLPSPGNAWGWLGPCLWSCQCQCSPQWPPLQESIQGNGSATMLAGQQQHGCWWLVNQCICHKVGLPTQSCHEDNVFSISGFLTSLCPPSAGHKLANMHQPAAECREEHTNCGPAGDTHVKCCVRHLSCMMAVMLGITSTMHSSMLPAMTTHDCQHHQKASPSHLGVALVLSLAVLERT